jgi:tRNA (adenine57-N1/adenine58-N1)-methyltransferase
MAKKLLIVRVSTDKLSRKRIKKEGESVSHMVEKGKDFHCKDGKVNGNELKEGSSLKTNIGVPYAIVKPSFHDFYIRMQRLAQVVPLKDLGAVISYTGIGPESTVIDAGTGSGAVAIFLAHFCRKVVSYDVRQDHQAIAKKNLRQLGITNVELRLRDVTLGFDEKRVDLIFMDLPQPGKLLDECIRALRLGGYLVSYSPSITQTQEMVNMAREKGWVHERTIENIERDWEIHGRIVRPKTQGIGHSGFLSFLRKVQ